MSDIRLQKYVSITSGAIAGGGGYVPYTPDEGVGVFNLTLRGQPLTLGGQNLTLGAANG